MFPILYRDWIITIWFCCGRIPYNLTANAPGKMVVMGDYSFFWEGQYWGAMLVLGRVFDFECLHEEFQVPKMEVLNLIRPFWGWVFPYVSLTYSLYRWIPPFYVPSPGISPTGPLRRWDLIRRTHTIPILPGILEWEWYESMGMGIPLLDVEFPLNMCVCVNFQWFCPHTLGRYPRLRQTSTKKEISSETVGEGSRVSSWGIWVRS